MLVKSKYKAILFDLDDTLIDFQKAEQKSLLIIYENIYKPFTTLDNFTLLFHQINKSLWQDFEDNKLALGTLGRKRFDILSNKLSATIEIDYTADLYERSLGATSEWLPGVLETLTLFKENFCLGVVTNGFSKVQRLKYQNLSLSSWFQCYIISEEVGFFKPDKRIFDMALHKMGYQPHEVLMVGDSINSDYKGALKAGLDFCWVNQLDQKIPTDLPEPAYNSRSVANLAYSLTS